VVVEDVEANSGSSPSLGRRFHTTTVESSDVAESNRASDDIVLDMSGCGREVVSLDIASLYRPMVGRDEGPSCTERIVWRRRSIASSVASGAIDVDCFLVEGKKVAEDEFSPHASNASDISLSWKWFIL
jgi:hypothetical protein